MDSTLRWQPSGANIAESRLNSGGHQVTKAFQGMRSRGRGQESGPRRIQPLTPSSPGIQKGAPNYQVSSMEAPQEVGFSQINKKVQ